VIAFFLALFVFVAVLGGARKIEGVATLIIPIASAAYIIMCLFTILSNVKILPSVVTEILKGAFSFKSAASGIALYGFSSVREGFSRGLLSNEAGAGTSAMAQSRASSVSASGVGLLGILEVFFDTAFLCTLTGLSVLVSANAPQNGSGMSMVVSALSAVFGRLSAPLLFVLVFAFAYSTIICWYYYGSQCLYYLFAKEKSAVYSALYIFASFIGAWIPYELLIYTTDYILLVMSLITLITLLKKSERIVYLSEKDGLLKKSYSRQKLNSGTFK
jgi:AGCS family alanine or glycine:cation symporter